MISITYELDEFCVSNVLSPSIGGNKRTNCPNQEVDVAIDKLRLTTKQYVNSSYLKRVSYDSKPVHRKRFFRSGMLYNLRNGASVYIYKNRDQVEIDLIPNHFSSWLSCLLFLKTLLSKGDLEEPKIMELHFNVDIEGIRASEINKMVAPQRMRKLFVYSQYKEERDGRLENWTLDIKWATLNLGSKNYRQYVVYDAAARHGLPEPTTRIEYRIKKPSLLREYKLNWFPKYILSTDPFHRVKFYKSFGKSFDKPLDRVKADYLRYLVREHGVFAAKKQIAATVPKYKRVSSFGRLLKDFEPAEIPLDDIFRERFGDFIHAAPSKAEKQLFTLIPKPIRE